MKKNIITVYFMDTTSNQPRGRGYDYYIEDNLLESLSRALEGSNNVTNQFRIHTTSGDTYRDNPVIFTRIRYEDVPNLKTINEIFFYHNQNRYKNEKYTKNTLTQNLVNLYSSRKRSGQQWIDVDQSPMSCPPPPITLTYKDTNGNFMDLTVPNDMPTLGNLNNNTKESTTMFDDMMKTMKFGPYNGKNVRLSMQGMAVKTPQGRYNAYDRNTNTLTDVTDFLIEGFGDVFWMMPVAQKAIALGDVIFHNDSPVIVSAIDEDTNSLTVVDVSRGEMIKKLPQKNVFGMDFYSKLVNVTEDLFKGINGDNPFGMFPMLALATKSDNPLMKMMLMNQLMGNGATGLDMSQMNPLMLMAFMGSGDGMGSNDDLMSLLLMTSMFKDGVNPFAGK